ncbi:MAG: long-chain fatty acid--CoA ligase [bacterium]
MIKLENKLCKNETDVKIEKPWLKNYPDDIPITLDYSQISVSQILDNTAKKYPENIALIFVGRKITYKELSKLVNKLATALHNLGVKKGDKVALFLPNCPQFVISYYAALKIGAIVVPTNPLYTERELEYQLNNSGSQTIITLDVKALYPKIANVKDKTRLKRIIISDIREYLPFPESVLYPMVKRMEIAKVEKDEMTYFLKELLDEYIAKPPVVEINSEEDLALLQYTGGTTGVPKGVMLSHRNLVVNAIQCRHWFSKAKIGKETFLSVLPFFHVFGMTVCMNVPIYLASSIILVPRFKIDDVLKIINNFKPTIFPGVPPMYVVINNYSHIKKYDLSSIKFCISGAAPLTIEVAEEFERITGGVLVEGFGLTECSPVTHCNPLYGKRKVGSIGLPLPDTDMKITDLETGEKILNIGQVGELAIKGPQVMKGYWQMPEETTQVIRNGWLYTGDIAKLDEDGYTFIVDRKKDVIIVGGENVYPKEVEEILYQHPKVKEATVIGLPDVYRSEVVKAYIILKDGQTATPQEIREFCKKNLIKHAVPKFVEFRKELPKTLIGKVLRRVLLEEEMKKKHTCLNGNREITKLIDK